MQRKVELLVVVLLVGWRKVAESDLDSATFRCLTEERQDRQAVVALTVPTHVSNAKIAKSALSQC